MLKLSNVCFSYGENRVLNNFSLAVEKGECICLKGKSGCGKTTVSRLLLGLEVPDSGEVFTPSKISCVFQEDRLLNNLSLKRNLFLVLDKEKKDYALKLAEFFGLKDSLNLRVSSLSGGMKRRAAIIRAIAYGGDALILDEAFSGLDKENKKKAVKLISEQFILKDKPVLMISHIKEDAELLGAAVLEMK